MSEPCWEVVTVNDADLDIDFVAHYATKAEATAALEDYDGPGGARIEQRTRVCHAVQCDICGEDGEESDSGANHFDATQVPDVIENLGWTAIPVGTGAICDMCCTTEIARIAQADEFAAHMEPMF